MEKKKITINLGTIIGNVGTWFLSSAFIYWGWTVIAPHLNCPLFDFWEIFAMRMAFSSIIRILHQK